MQIAEFYAPLREKLEALDEMTDRHEKEHQEAIKSVLEEAAKIRTQASTIKKGEKGDMPIAGIHFPFPKNGKDADEKGIEERVLGRVLAQIKQPRDGKDAIIDYKKIARKVFQLQPRSQEGKHLTAEDVIDAMRQLPPEKRLSPEDMPGFEEAVRKFWQKFPKGYLHGGGITTVTAGSGVSVSFDVNGNPIISATGGSTTILQTTSGAVNDSNVTFGFSEEPTLININGLDYLPTGGSITWTWNSSTMKATLSEPVGSGGSIFGKL